MVVRSLPVDGFQLILFDLIGKEMRNAVDEQAATLKFPTNPI